MKRFLSSAIVLLTFLLPPSAIAKPGQVDFSFGHRGIATLPTTPGESRANDVATDIDGNMIVVGENDTHPFIGSLDPNGSPNTAFGDSGLITDLPWTCRFCRDPLLSIVKYGSLGFMVGGVDSRYGMVARINARGGLKPLFGSGDGFTGTSGIVRGLAVDGGRVLAVMDDRVTRLNADGTPDGTFGIRGRVGLAHAVGYRGEFGGNHIATTPDGSVYISGYLIRGKTETAVVVKLNRDGSADQSFGENGLLKIHSGYASDLDVNRRGLFVSVTRTSGTGGWGRASVYAFNPTGEPLRDFGDKGMVLAAGRPSYSSNIAWDGRYLIVETGSTDDDARHSPITTVAGYRFDGTLQSEFGRNGRTSLKGVIGNGFSFDNRDRILISGLKGKVNRPTAVVVRLKGHLDL